MSKKILYILLIAFTMSSLSLSAQDNSEEMLQSAKIAFITRRVAISPEQAKTFWPIYDAFSSAKSQNRQQQKQLMDGAAAKSDTQIEAELNKFIELRQRDVSIDQEFIKKFQKVITSRQIVELFKAEHQFQKILMKTLANRKGQGGAKGGDEGDD